MWQYTYSGDLYHHGIKGQKWGVRRFQDKNGGLTNKGRRRYLDDPTVKQSKQDLTEAKSNKKIGQKAYSKANNAYGLMPTSSNIKKLDNAQSHLKSANKEVKSAKFKYKTEKEAVRIADKNVSFEKKSKHRLKLEEQYRLQGLNEEQAQAAANNRIRSEKVLATAAAMTVAACTVYYLNNKRKSRIDGIIKAGESLQRMEMANTNGQLHNTFYVSKGAHDNKRYAGLLGYTRRVQTGKAYIMKLQANADIKVASKDKAVKAFSDLYKTDNDFRKQVQAHVSSHFSGANAVKDTNKLSNRNMKKMYENFNSALVDLKGSGADKKFYDKLKFAGYGAVQDINDMKFSGYNAKNPLIVFDNSGNKVGVKTVKEMTGNLKKSATVEQVKSLGESFTKDFMSKGAPAAAVGLTGAAAVIRLSKPSAYNAYTKQQKFVEKYKKEHPSTKLSDKEIAKLM